MEYTPFSGPRLNQLTEEELRYRNEHMSAQTNILRFKPGMTDDERNALSREYYANLTESQAYGRTEHHQGLPYAWRERLATSVGLSHFQESTNSKLATNNSNIGDQWFKLLSDASEETKSAQRQVQRLRQQMRDVLAREPFDKRAEMELELIKEEVEEATKEYNIAQDKEKALLDAISKK